jgi:hypothetical protein
MGWKERPYHKSPQTKTCDRTVLSACLGRLLQENIGAHGLDPDQTQTTRKGFILCQRDLLHRHLVSQPCALCVAVCHHGFFYATIDLLLGPIRGPYKAIEPCQFQYEAHQANPTRANLDTHQV